jgi:hypothetical protein
VLKDGEGRAEVECCKIRQIITESLGGIIIESVVILGVETLQKVLFTHFPLLQQSEGQDIYRTKYNFYVGEERIKLKVIVLYSAHCQLLGVCFYKLN